MKTLNFAAGPEQVSRGRSVFSRARIVSAVLCSVGLFFLSCINPIGFTPDLSLLLSGSETTTPNNTNQPDKPGDTSPIDNPNQHPDPDKGIIIFKNLTGGEKAKAATFTITGQEHADINTSILLDTGQEKSIVLLPGRYDIVISFEGGGPFLGSKVLLPGHVEYVYFYVGKDGSYKGGINVDSSFVYGDLNLNFYQDNENAGDNRDGDGVTTPEEGDVSRDDYPRHKLPAYLRENYGIVWVHNMSLTRDLMNVLFDHYTNNTADDPAALDAHWEMNPGPGTGGIMSIILRPGEWKARALWILAQGDAADPNLSGGVIERFAVLKAGQANYINHLYFYKGNDGKWYLTDKQDPNTWNPPCDNTDLNPAGGTEGGGGDLTQAEEEGQFTHEGGTIDIGNSWWEGRRNDYGILVVKNLSSRVAVNTVEFTYQLNALRYYQMGRVSPRSDRSIILGKGAWSPVTVAYTLNGTPHTLTETVNIFPLGLTGRLNYLYFYYTGNGYAISAGDTPPDYQNDADISGSTPGYEEGNSPGALNDSNRGTLGLLILQNLSSDTAVDWASFTGKNTSQVGTTYNMNPGPAIRDQKSILLGAGGWKVQAYYTGPGSPTTEKTANIVAGQVTYMYFYKTLTGGYSVSPSWPPVPNDALGDNTDPGAIIGDDEGWVHIINKSAVSTLDRIQYNNGGTWIDIAIPSGTIAPSYESDPDLVVNKGTWSFRFKIATKPTYSQTVSKTIRAGQVTILEYTDALDSDLPPAGFGTLRIVNDTSNTITKVVSRTRDASNNYIAHEEAIPVIAPKGQTGSTQIGVLSSGGAGRFKDYIIQCYTSDTMFYEETALIEDGKISTIVLSDTTPKVVVNPQDPDLNDTHGGLLVVNKYSGVLPFKVFRIYLYKQTDVLGDGTKIWESSYVAPDSNPYQENFPGIPAGANQSYNGTMISKDDYLVVNQSKVFAPLEEGNYKLFIFAGSYTWDYYEGNNMAGSIPINWKRIAYDCGELFISGNARKVYNFDPYMPGVNDRDTPNGIVTLILNHSGGTTTNSYGGTISHTQIIMGTTVSGGLTPTSPAYVTGIARPTPADPAKQASTTNVDKGGPTNNVAGGFVPTRYIVYDYPRTLTPGNSLTLYLPPGIYGMRILDLAAGSTKTAWYGRSDLNYLDLYLLDEASKTVSVSWYFGSYLEIRTALTAISYIQVPESDRDLSGYITAPDTGSPLTSAIASPPAFWTLDSVEWYYSTGSSGDSNDWYNYSSVSTPKPGKFPVRITNPAAHTVESGRYYTGVFMLKPSPGFTFSGLPASSGTNKNAAVAGGGSFTCNAYPQRAVSMSSMSFTPTRGMIKNETAGQDGRIKVIIYFPKTN
jgi:hypothetical protein